MMEISEKFATYDGLIGPGSSNYDRRSSSLFDTEGLLDHRKASQLIASLFDFANDSPGDVREFLEGIRSAAENGSGEYAEFSSGLLAAFAHVFEGLLEHQETIPLRAFEAYLKNGLGFREQAARPDEVAAVFSGDPKKLPQVIDRGSRISSGTAPEGRRERVYETIRPLTVQPVDLTQLISLHRKNTRQAWIAPFANTRDGLGTEFEDHEDPLWPPLGTADRGELVRHELRIVSPELRLDGGDRLIKLFLSFPTRLEMEHPHELFQGCGYELVSFAGRMKLDDLNVVLPWPYSSARIKIKISPNRTYEPHASENDIPEVPYLSITPPVGEKRNNTFWLRVDNIGLKVEGTNLPAHSIITENGEANPLKPFHPFGAVGYDESEFFFAAPELLSKNVRDFEKCSVDITGEELSGNFYVYQGKESGFGEPLFGVDSLTSLDLRSAQSVDISRSPDGAFQLDDPNLDGRGWIKVKKTKYTIVISAYTNSGEITGQTVEEAEGVLFENNVDPTSDRIELDFPPPPLPSKIQSLRLNYSTKYITVKASGTTNYFEQYINGKKQPESSTTPFKLFPEAPAIISHLYLGFEGAATTRLLTLYFDIEQQPAPEFGSPDASVRFEFSGESGTWAEPSVDDGTFGLRQSGIVTLSFNRKWARGCPDFASDLGSDQCWIRLSSDHPELAGLVRGIHPNAVLARYVVQDPENDGTSAVPLPIESLKRLKKPVVGVKKVKNPGISVGGRAPEDRVEFLIRASERLRHRGRASTIWDFERLVLNEFPDVRLVRCFPHLQVLRSGECLSDAGTVTLVIVPWSESPHPLLTESLRQRILRFLSQRCSPGLELHAMSARFIKVGIRADITVGEDEQPFLVEQEIRKGLSQVLMPWRVESIGATAFGTPLYRSQVVRWIEALPAVKHINSLEMLAGGSVTEIAQTHPALGLITDSGLHEFDVQVDL